MGTRVVAIVAAVMVAGCGQRQDAFPCTDDDSCGPGGKCELDVHFCSFRDPNNDPNCLSGRVFGGLGGTHSGQCVDRDAGPPDGLSDASLFCYGTAPISICFATPPAETQNYTGPIDTTNSAECATNVVSGGSNFCVLAAGTITVDATLRATGSKPLVLLATDSITTTGAIDVGSHRGATPETGAGADPADCATMAGTAPTAGGGGAGGSFAGQGGAGAVSANAGSTGSVAGRAATTPTLRGGCPGQNGDGPNKGTGGHGGGAVLMIAATTIIIGNDITAGGEGGAGGVMNTSGGGGGGAGGMIWLDAPMVMNPSNRLILANGGAGGEGSGVNTGTAGAPGEDSTTTSAAIGGHQGPGNGGDGGDGSAGAPAGPGQPGFPGTVTSPSLNGGGGAGGGGAGLVKARTGVNLGTRVSPAMTPQ